MKNISIPLIVVILLISLSFSALSIPAAAMAKSPKTEGIFENSSGWKKADLHLRKAWGEANKKGNDNAVLECIMKTTSKISDDQRKELKSTGYKFRTVIGAIITGSLKAKDLPAVANLEFVQAIELATPMTLKTK